MTIHLNTLTLFQVLYFKLKKEASRQTGQGLPSSLNKSTNLPNPKAQEAAILLG